MALADFVENLVDATHGLNFIMAWRYLTCIAINHLKSERFVKLVFPKDF